MNTYGVLLIIAGIIITVLGYKVRDKIAKYEFENRTSGGNVEFQKFSDTKKHAAKGCLGNFLGVLGIITLFVGVIILVFNYTKL